MRVGFANVMMASNRNSASGTINDSVPVSSDGSSACKMMSTSTSSETCQRGSPGVGRAHAGGPLLAATSD